jgi:TonB family protein
MSTGMRIILAIVGGFFATMLAVIQLASKTPQWQGWLPSAFCITISMVCIPGIVGRVASRVLGASIFLLCCLYVSFAFAPDSELTERGHMSPVNALCAFFFFGLPAGFVAVFGHLPRLNVLTSIFGGNKKNKTIEHDSPAIDAQIAATVLAEEKVWAERHDRWEHQASQDPIGYKRRIVLLAALGYAYIAGVMLLLAGILAFTILLVFHSHYVVIGKFILIPLIALGLILKSLWVKFEEPQGVAIKDSDAPALFEAINETRAAARALKIDKVILTSEFNCAIVQLPRLGAFGWYQNLLILGLPLMYAMPVSHFRSVLAHEMGHVSHLHGRFGAWVYQIQMSWLQLCHNLSNHSVMGTGLFRRFAEWYFPLFDAYTLVLRRTQELAADQISSSLSNPQVCAQALVHVAVKSLYSQQVFWPKQLAALGKSPEPPSGITTAFSQAVKSNITSEKVKTLLRQLPAKQDRGDSHPALTKRIAALSVDSSAENLIAIFESSASAFLQQPSAAEKLLGESLPKFVSLVDESWRKQVSEVWELTHAEWMQHVRELEQLDKHAEESELCKEDAIERARLTCQVGESDRGLNMLQTLLVAHPNDLEIQYLIGALLLEQENEEGIDYLKRIIECGREGAYQACIELSDYLIRQGNEQEAGEYAEKSKYFLRKIEHAASAVPHVTREDTFEPHRLSTIQLDRLCALLHADPRIKQAWLLRRVIPDILGGGQPVLVLSLNSPRWFSVSHEEVLQAIPDLACNGQLEKYIIMVQEDIHKNLGATCKTLPGAFIYDRKLWQPGQPNSLPVTASYPLDGAPKRNFWVQNRGTLVGFGVLALIIWGLLQVRPPVHNRSSQLVTKDGINFDPYMANLQHKIKEHWYPPRLSEDRKVELSFSIDRRGTCSNVWVTASSGVPNMDKAALRAIKQSAPFDPLPVGASPTVNIHFTLDYNVRRTN